MEARFTAAVWEWRGPAPFYWVTLPDDESAELRDEAARASYGWGAIPVRVRIGSTEWETSLLPKDGAYVVPLKAAIRKAEGLGEGDAVNVHLVVAPRNGRQANGSGPAC